MTYRNRPEVSDSVNLGSNPSSPATENADVAGVSSVSGSPDKPEISEQTAHSGSTKVGTAPYPIDLVSLAAGPMLTEVQRRALVPPCGKGPRGHVAPPGTGPEGETCGSCKHIVRKSMSKVYLKCGLNRAKWTGGGKSDIRARDHACRLWEPSA